MPELPATVVPADEAPSPAYVRTRQAAALLGVSFRSLITWRSRGGGPAFRRVGPGGRTILYELKDLVEWAQSRPKMRSTKTVAT
jgi:hypothetical protein